MAEAPVLSTKNNNNNISPQAWELGLSQRQSGGGEVLALSVLVLVLVLVQAFGCCTPQLGSERSSAIGAAAADVRVLPAAERSVSDGVPSARFPARRPLLALI